MTDKFQAKDFRVKFIDDKFANGMLKLPGPMHGELVELLIVQEMEREGIDPAVIYAYEKTLLWITNGNRKDAIGRPTFTQKQLDAWAKAQVQYYLRQKAVNG